VTTALGRDTVASPRPQLWRVTDRAAFQAIRRAGHRTRRGPLTVTWLPPIPGAPAEPPRAAFAIGRSVGGAVVRNRIRRRLRAGMRELQAAGRLPDGSYLLSGGAELAHLPWPALCDALAEAVAAASSAVGDAR
jgi:ribonuclease P protein component